MSTLDSPIFGVGQSDPAWFSGWRFRSRARSVLLRALEAEGILESPSGRIAVGWLIVEDLVTVLILVLLPALATALGGETGPRTIRLQDNDACRSIRRLASFSAKFIGFVLLMLVVGSRLLPWLLGKVAATGSRELFTLAVIAVAIGIGFGAAEVFGLSFALGAFFAGVVVGESDHSHRAAEEMKPLQDAFTALFFVAMGMLFDPEILVKQPVQVLAVLAIIWLGKSAVAFTVVVLLRQPRRSRRLSSRRAWRRSGSSPLSLLNSESAFICCRPRGRA